MATGAIKQPEDKRAAFSLEDDATRVAFDMPEIGELDAFLQEHGESKEIIDEEVLFGYSEPEGVRSGAYDSAGGSVARSSSSKRLLASYPGKDRLVV